MSIESVTPSNHLILIVPFSSCLQSFLASRSFLMSQFFTSCAQRPKYWSISFSISPSNEYSGLISFRIDWFDLLVPQGILKPLPHHQSSKTSILWHSAFFMVQLSHPYVNYWKNRSFDYIDFCWQSAQKSLYDPDNHVGVIAHLEPDILECEVKWALGSITMDSEIWEKVKILKSTLRNLALQ